MLKKTFVALFLLVFTLVGIKVCPLNINEENIKLEVHKKGVYVASIDRDYFVQNSEVFVSETLETVADYAEKNKVKIAINAGFFDPQNSKTISYIVKNGQITHNPIDNERFTQREDLSPYMEKILNRSEFRMLNCSGNMEYNITQRNTPVDSDCFITYSVQAGPALLPQLNLEEEFFIVKKDSKVTRQSASALGRVARSAVGITEDRILIVAASNYNPMTLKELADFMRQIGAKEALAFDGGSSTSFYADLPLAKIVLSSAKDDYARKVKSILIVR